MKKRGIEDLTSTFGKLKISRDVEESNFLTKLYDPAGDEIVLTEDEWYRVRHEYKPQFIVTSYIDDEPDEPIKFDVEYISYKDILQELEDMIQGDCSQITTIDNFTGEVIATYHDVRNEESENYFEGREDLVDEDYKKLLDQINNRVRLNLLFMGNDVNVLAIPNSDNYIITTWHYEGED